MVISNNDPSLYKRRVLLISGGGSPAVITETFYGLINLPRAFIPTEIHVVTTEFGYKAIKKALFAAGQPSLVEQLWTHHKPLFAGFGPPQFTLEKHVHIIRDLKTGEPLKDIIQAEDCDATADLFKQLTFSFFNDPDCALHCSLAGGRKVMSFYSGYLFSLGGREQDCLSHTLLHPPEMENSKDFYYPLPDQSHCYRHHASKETVSIRADDIAITIVNIPFAPLLKNQQFRDALFDPSISYSNAINYAKGMVRDPDVRADLYNVRVNQDIIPLNAQSMAYYLLLLIFADGISLENMSVEQAKVMTNIYNEIKGPTDEVAFFDKHLRQLASRRKLLKSVKHQTLERFAEHSSADPRNIQPDYNRQTKKHFIAIAPHIARQNAALTARLKRNHATSGLSEISERYIEQHLNKPL